MGVAQGKSRVVQINPSYEDLVLKNTYYLDELGGLRQQFQDDSSTIKFGEKAMFVLYSPPEYPTHWAAKYLGGLLNIPVLYPDEYIRQCIGSHEADKLHLKNMSSRYLLRQKSSTEESPTREALRRRIYQKDCENGCILYEYPETCRELKYVMKNIASHLKVYLLFLELDNEVSKFILCLL